jgi:hypothetical protein
VFTNCNTEELVVRRRRDKLRAIFWMRMFPANFQAGIWGPMSRVFSIVFCGVVCYLVVYNVLVMFPSIRHDPAARAALKFGTVLVTVTIAKLIFRPRPRSVSVKTQSVEGLSYVDPDNAHRFEV